MPTWPGVTLNEKPGDQVRVHTERYELRRASVLFRFNLLVPASIVLQAVTLGSLSLLLVMWLWGSAQR